MKKRQYCQQRYNNIDLDKMQLLTVETLKRIQCYKKAKTSHYCRRRGNAEGLSSRSPGRRSSPSQSSAWEQDPDRER